MDMRTVAVLALLATLIPHRPASAGDAADGVLRYVPAASPAVLVVNDPSGLYQRLKSFGAFNAPLETETAPGTDGLAGLLALLGIAHLPEGLDEKGSLLVAVPQFPFPLIAAPVTDYPLFLKSLSPPGIQGAPAPPSPLPGVDMVLMGGKPLFARHEGNFALLSPSPLLLNPPGDGSSLSRILSADEKEIMEDANAFLRLDVGILLALVEPFIRQGLSGLGTGPPDPPAKNQSPLKGRQDVGRLLSAEADLLLQGLRQVRSFSVGLKVSEEAIDFSSAYLAQPESAFQAMLRKQTPRQPASFLRYFDGDAAMAGTVHLDRESLEAITSAVTDFLFSSGVYNLSEADRGDWEQLAKAGLEIAGNHSAYYFGPSKSGGNFSTIFISEVQDAGRARSIIRDSLTLAEKLLAAPGLDPAMTVEFEEAAESHRGVAIDRYSFTLSPPAGEKDGEEFNKAMESVFGGDRIKVWTAFLDRYLVASYYTSTSTELKAMIDRLQEGRTGSLLESAPFREATRGLPEEGISLSFFSLPRFMSLVVEMMGRMAPEEKIPPLPLADGTASGIGISYRSSGGALRVDTHIPRQEAMNLRILTDYFKTLPKRGTGRTTPL